MSQGSVDLLERGIECFERRDVEAAMGLRDLGDQALAIGTMRARGAESGAEIESPWAWLLRSKKGKATSIRVFTDPAEAIEAAGAPE